MKRINKIKLGIIWAIALGVMTTHYLIIRHMDKPVIEVIIMMIVWYIYDLLFMIHRAVQRQENCIKLGKYSIGYYWIAWSGEPYINPTGEYECRECHNYSVTFKDSDMPWFGYYVFWYNQPFHSYVIAGISFNWAHMPYICKDLETDKIITEVI